MLIGPIFACSSFCRIAASSASGVGVGGRALVLRWTLRFLGWTLRRPRGRCAAAGADHPAQHQPQPVAPIQKRRFRFGFAVVDSHDQPAISSLPQVSQTPAIPAYPTEQTPETGTFPPRFARGIWTSWGARRLAASPLHHLHARIESQDATRFRETCTKSRGPPGFLRPASSTRASQAHSPPHEPRCARLRRAKGSVRMGVDEAHLDLMITMTIPLDRSED